MSTDHTVKAQRDDGRDLNARMLASLLMLQFFEEFDKATADTPGPAAGTVSALKPKVRVRFGGGIKSITVTVPE